MAAKSHKPKPETCTGVPGLVYRQIEMCKNNPDAILCVGEGVRRGIYECQSQFRYERWNCSTIQSDSVFGPVLAQCEYDTKSPILIIIIYHIPLEETLIYLYRQI